MKEKKYKWLLALTVASMLICMSIPFYRAHYCVRHADEWEGRAWYTEASSTSSHNNDAVAVYILTLPSMLIIYASFFHYLLLQLRRPDEETRNILPVFYFRNRFPHTMGKILSYICIYTIPVLLPIGVYLTYWKTYTDYEIIFIFPFMLMVGAFLFFNCYIIFFIRKILLYRKKKKYGLPDDDTDKWFVY